MSKRALRILPYRGERAYQYYLDGLKVNGKRKRRFFKTQKEALAELKARQKQLRKEGEDGAEISADLRIEAVQAQQRLAPFDKSIRDAVAFYAEHLERLRGSVPVSAVFNDYCQAKERAGLSQKHLADIRLRLGRFVAKFGPRLIKSVSVHEIEDWLHGLALSPQTVINHRAILRAFFEYGLQRDLVEKNPVTPIAKVKLKGGKAPEIFTPAELAEVLNAAPFEILPAIAIQAFCGLRTAEVLRLAWSEVDLARAYVTVSATKSKTAQRRLVPIAPNLADWLRPYAGSSGPVWPESEQQYHRTTLRFLRETNLPKWPLNGLRHSFASYHLAEHQNAAQLALALGHTSTKLIFSAYRELVTPEAAHQYWLIRPPTTPQNVVALAKAAAV